MARNIRDIKLDTRTARRELPIKSHPYWRTISRGAHLGYRKGKDGSGSWLARIGVGNGTYKQTRIGTADDIQDPNGLDILNFTQAQDKARKWFDRIAHEQAGIHYGVYTVGKAIEDYLAWYKIHRKAYKQTKYVIDAHIRTKFGNKEISKLTTHEIREWFEKMISVPPRKRTQKNKQQEFFNLEDNEEALRKRKSTANRNLNVLKAILNKAYHDGKVPSDDAWRRIKPFRNVDSPRSEYLDLDEVIRLVNASPQDLRDIICGALYTGCRYSELTKMQVQDFKKDTSQIFVKPSKNGKSRWAILTDEGHEFFEQHCAGKSATELIFTKADEGQWGRSHQQRPLKEAVKKAGITKDINFHTLRHTHASQLAMQGVPLQVIARQLGHYDTRMVEKHYAHLAPDYIADTIRAHFPTLGINQKSNVTVLRQV